LDGAGCAALTGSRYRSLKTEPEVGRGIGRVLSRYTVLPWEDAEEYRALVAALVAEHAPQGPTEEHKDSGEFWWGMPSNKDGSISENRDGRLNDRGSSYVRAICTAPVHRQGSESPIRFASPGEPLRQRIDLIVMAAGKRQQLGNKSVEPRSVLGQQDRAALEQVDL
jgi:hypothetical protein